MSSGYVPGNVGSDNFPLLPLGNVQAQAQAQAQARPSAQFNGSAVMTERVTMGHEAESAAMLAGLQAYKAREAERAERGRRSTMYIRPEDNGFEVEQEDANPFAFVVRDEGAPPDLIKRSSRLVEHTTTFNSLPRTCRIE